MATKPVQPAPITAVPTPVPSRTDRANFPARGDALMTWFPDGVDGINDSVDYINDAADFVSVEVDALLAGSSFKGDWSTLSGALAKPACVRHLNRFWLLLSNLANVAASAPADGSAYWAAITTDAGVVGQSRNLRASVTAASASCTLTADEIVVAMALGGSQYRLSSFSKTVNLGTTGAGGMDAGSAPVSGFVALYAIYNPTSGASALLAVNASSTVAPSAYAGANMPAGYTASALVSVWPTNGSGQFKVGFQRERVFSTSPTIVYTSSTATGSYASLSVAGSVPPNAVSVKGYLNPSSSSSTAGVNISVAADTSGSDFIYCYGVGFAGVPFLVQLLTQQTIYYTTSLTAGTPTFNIAVTGYSF